MTEKHFEFIAEEELANIIGGSSDKFWYTFGETAHKFMNSPIKSHQSGFTGNNWN